MVKIIVIIITAFVVGLLSIGLLIPETVYSTEVRIARPLPSVFSLFNDS